MASQTEKLGSDTASIADESPSVLQSKVRAIERSQAVVAFDLEGRVINANANFLALVGYGLEEIRGKPHRTFCEPGYADTAEYASFWASLRAGEFHEGEYKRLGKAGRQVWIRASYNPLLDESGMVVGIVKYAMDVSQGRALAAENSGKMDAIGRAMAVIEFDIDGNVLWANDNFHTATGYRLEDITGQHHRMFCDRDYSQSDHLSRLLGEARSRSISARRVPTSAQRRGRCLAAGDVQPHHGGRVSKIVKFALDITLSKTRNIEFESRVNAISRAQAVIEFDFDGNVLAANENFLRVVGYSLEIIGRHHSNFCGPCPRIPGSV